MKDVTFKIPYYREKNLIFLESSSFPLKSGTAAKAYLEIYCSTKRPFRTFLVEFPFLVFHAGFRRGSEIGTYRLSKNIPPSQHNVPT